MSKWERHKSTFALSKVYNANFSLFDRMSVDSGQANPIAKKAVNRTGPSILDILRNRKKSKSPDLMGIEKFVFVLEHGKRRSEVSYREIIDVFHSVDSFHRFINLF